MRNIDYENLHYLNRPFLEGYKKSFADVLQSGWFILGKNVEKFEREFADYLGCRFFIGVASGLDALEIPLKAYDFPAGSEVIVPSNTYIATVNAVLNSGHIPVFVEPNIHTYNIDPQKIEAKITPKTRAIMLVHLYGQSCEMYPILDICKKYNLKLIEDCAQSHGATYKGKMTGTFGDAGAFSFYPTKNLGALGDAGGIALNDETLYKKLKAWRNYGSHVKYQNEYIGDNSRLDEIQASFLSVKLQSLDYINRRKNQIAKYYLNHLKSDYILPTTIADNFNVFHIFPIRHPRRNDLRDYLLAHGIKTEIHYPIAPCDQKSIQNWATKNAISLNSNDFQLAKIIHATELSLPCSPIHADDDIEYIVKIMNRF